jgi:hypothetical protein
MRFPKITNITLKGKKPTEMDPTEKRRMEESGNLSFKTFSGTMSGFVGGGVLGVVVASWYDVLIALSFTNFRSL